MSSTPTARAIESPVVSIRGVDFSYAPGERQILGGLQMEFRRGQVVAVMGGSGCGKTTVLRLIGGQVTAQTGSVEFEGHEISAMNTDQLMQARRRMGMLFQFGGLQADQYLLQARIRVAASSPTMLKATIYGNFQPGLQHAAPAITVGTAIG